jgi:hypothetical protein
VRSNFIPKCRNRLNITLLVRPFLKDSKESYSIESKFRWDNISGATKAMDAKNNEELRKMNQKMDKVIEIWGMSIPLKIAA